MKRKSFGILLLIMIIVFTSCCNAEVNDSAESNIAWLMKLYGFTLPDNVIRIMHTCFLPQTYDCGEIQVNLQEILYDGIWLYTSATVIPINPNKTLIMPSSAGIDDFVAGGYHENLRDDSRSFLEAAMEDEKELLYVRIYPVEFDQIEYYFTDHRQDAGCQSTVFSGAPVSWIDNVVTINLLIQVGRIDFISKEIACINTYSYPITVNRIGSILSRKYHVNQDNSPIISLSMTQTPLSVYAFPTWRRGVIENSNRFSLLDDFDNPIAHGSPPDTNTFLLSELQDELSLLISPRSDPKHEELVSFSITAEKE